MSSRQHTTNSILHTTCYFFCHITSKILPANVRITRNEIEELKILVNNYYTLYMLAFMNTDSNLPYTMKSDKQTNTHTAKQTNRKLR